MECPATSVLFGLFGILLGGFIGHRLALGRDRRARIDCFVSSICELKSLAEKIEDVNFPEWVAKSQVSVERECGLVQGSIGIFWRKEFRSVRERYYKIQRPDIEDFDKVKLPVPQTMSYQLGRLLVERLLSELIACGK